MNQVTVFVVPAALVLLQLLAGAELLADTEHAGEDTFGWDLQIGGEKGSPVEVIRCTALETENMVDRGDHQVKVLLPVNETGGRLLALAAVTWVHEVGEGLEGGLCVRRALGIEHSKQGFGLVHIGEVRIVEHDEDLEDHAEIGADGIFSAGDGDGSG